MSASYISTFLVSPSVRDVISQNRERGHVHVMSAFRRGVGASPRAGLKILWHIDEASATLTVQSSEPAVSPGLLGEAKDAFAVVYPDDGDVIEFRVDRNCQKTPRVELPLELRAQLERRDSEGHKLPGQRSYRARQVVVPDDERAAWARSRLAISGLDAAEDEIRVSGLKFAGLGSRGRGIPYVELRGRARVTSAETFAKTVVSGTGKGKNFGLALLRFRVTAG